MPDPHDPATFYRSKLTHREHEDGPHSTLWQFYQELLRVRCARPALATLDLSSLDVHADEASKTLAVRRWAGNDQTLALFNFSDQEQTVGISPPSAPPDTGGEYVGTSGRSPSATEASGGLPLPRREGAGGWALLLDSTDARWRGPGSAIPGILPVDSSATVMLPPWGVALFGTEAPT